MPLGWQADGIACSCGGRPKLSLPFFTRSANLWNSKRCAAGWSKGATFLQFSTIFYPFLQFSTQDSGIDDSYLLGWALEIGWKWMKLHEIGCPAWKIIRIYQANWDWWHLNAHPVSGCCSCLVDMVAAVICGGILYDGLNMNTECPPACMMLQYGGKRVPKQSKTRFTCVPNPSPFRTLLDSLDWFS